MTFETAQLGTEVDAIAPDGSEIRLMGARPGGTFAHCTLAPGATSLAVRHRTVEEIGISCRTTGRSGARLTTPKRSPGSLPAPG
jgi:hypothetical protein